MSNRPLIGITIDCADRPEKYQIHRDYPAAVESAGGLPVLIPYDLDHRHIGPLLDRLDGILLIGGDDLDPSLYNQAWHPQAVRIDPARQSFELAMLAQVEARRIPTLGICLGCQMINVYRGGSLHQFLPDLPRENAIEHRKLDRQLPGHTVAIDVDSIIGKAIGQRELTVNTYHKQACARLGHGLRVVATAPDGIIEAFEDPSLPLLAAVQWHPERLSQTPEHMALFKLLVDRAAQFAQL